MAVEIECVTEVSDELAEAFAKAHASAFAPAGGTLPPGHGTCCVQRWRGAVRRPAGWPDRRVWTLVWYDVPSGRKAWVEDVVVDAAARGCGAGEALVKAATEHAARIGAAKVMLTSNPAREAARALYRKIGFEEAGTTVFVFKTDRK